MRTTGINIDIIYKLNEGSVNAFDALYKHYHLPVLANITKFIQQKDIAEDILQDVFMALWENRKNIDPLQDVGGWLFVVSYNKSIAVLKKRVNEKLIFTDSMESIIIADNDQTNDIQELQLHMISNAVNALSPRKKEVFELCRLQGKSYSEAAAALNLSTETVKDYLKDSQKFVKEFVFSKSAETTLLTIAALSLYL